MLTDLNKLKGIDFSKKYIENHEDLDNYVTSFFMQESKEYVNLEDYQDIENVECIDDTDFITSYVSYLMYGGSGEELAFKSKHIRFTEGLEILHSNLRVDDLKKILRKYNLKVSGNKMELISRIEENLSAEQLKEELPGGSPASEYVLTEKGLKYLEKYELHWYKQWIPPQFSEKEFILLCEKNPQYTSEEILFCLLYQDWININSNDINEDDFEQVITFNSHSRSFIASDVIEDIEMTCALLRKNLEDSYSISMPADCNDILYLSRIYRSLDRYDLALEVVNGFIDVYDDRIPAVLEERERILKNIK